jgi:membrane-bound lytic murein transglycosylase A
MSAARYFAHLSLFLILVFFIVSLWRWQFPDVDGTRLALQLDRVSYSQIDGWADDDHAAAYQAFLTSCAWSIAIAGKHDTPRRKGLADVCRHALSGRTAAEATPLSQEKARQFFETFFTPYRVTPDASRNIATGYYEPEIAGSRTRTDEFNIPVYAPPSDLVLIEAHKRGDLPAELTAARQTKAGLVRHFTRQEIDQGALEGLGLELAYISDPVAAYSMQLQGSARIRFSDGTAIRLGFAGKNGFSYTSIGQLLISRGELSAHEASLSRIFEWAKAAGDKGQRLIWENQSYIFFRVLSEAEGASGPVGALGTPLTPLRSVAVDPRYHILGAPIWVSANGLKDDAGADFSRLMIAQDTGSAIRGPVRADIYWGSGDKAGEAASRTKHETNFIILLPNTR